MRKRVSSPWQAPPSPSRATSPPALLPLATPPHQHLGRLRQDCCQGFLLRLEKSHIIFRPYLTGFFWLISVVNSFASGRFEGCPARSPASKLHWLHNNTVHCTLYTVHCTQSAQCTQARWTFAAPGSSPLALPRLLLIRVAKTVSPSSPVAQFWCIF